MSRLEEIQDELAVKIGFINLLDIDANGDADINMIYNICNEASIQYTKECVKASLEEAGEQLINEYPKLSIVETKIKKSITNPENIILL